MMGEQLIWKNQNGWVFKVKQVIEIIIEHGGETCAVSPEKFCKYFGIIYFGTIPVCRLFPSYDDNSHTFLKEKYGWIQRCEACIKATDRISPLQYKDY
jgi:hypothetical protein